VVSTDLLMPELDGITATGIISQKLPDPRVVALIAAPGSGALG
jgi:CheY-like chemotaxis protein